ncbi:hypothetical protein [Nocardia sp. NPDC057668]|uniref:hypothetical protein n=1 Tax=Nocardia sp. NPDC057668 TaxID=3346202 RepID=UPI00366B4042
MTYTVSAVTHWRPESLAERAAILAAGAEYITHTLESARHEADEIANGGWTGEAAAQAYARVEREHRMGKRCRRSWRSVQSWCAATMPRTYLAEDPASVQSRGPTHRPESSAG